MIIFTVYKDACIMLSPQQTELNSGTIRTTCGLIGTVLKIFWPGAKNHTKVKLEKTALFDLQHIYAVFWNKVGEKVVYVVFPGLSFLRVLM